MRRRWASTAAVSAVVMVAVTLSAIAIGGCGENVHIGSDVLWTARFEDGTFDEWTSVAGGTATAASPNTLEVSSERVHHGAEAAKLTITTAMSGVQESSSLSRAGGFPVQAFYSAWYYLPRSITVGTFWVIMKVRFRRVAADPTSDGELYDLDLVSLPSGEMSFILYDHRIGGNVVLGVVAPVVPVASWFQLEMFYRNAQDTTGRMTVWIDGLQIVDVANQAMAPTSWVGWNACSIGEDLTPNTAVLYVDDAAVSLTRVGPLGVIAE